MVPLNAHLSSHKLTIESWFHESSKKPFTQHLFSNFHQLKRFHNYVIDNLNHGYTISLLLTNTLIPHN